MKWHVFTKILVLKIGTSAAANLLAAKQIGKEKGANFNVVTVFPDAGSIEEWSDVKNLVEK